MSAWTQGRSARYLEWAVQRNPMYLISAALLAVGARLFLVHPSDVAGDIKLIVLTLGVLQAYECAVGAVLLVLYAAQRSPEDKPSLLLVAALFWTGPLAATIEMTTFRPDLGTSLAAGACLIAVAELRLICRILELRFTAAGQAVATACLVLLAAAAPLLKIPQTASGANELFLYGTWWALAGLVLTCLSIVRTYRRRMSPSASPETSTCLAQEITFLAVTTIATAIHLVGMNHAFYCHAVLFYASPLIIAVSVVGAEVLSLADKRNRCLLAAFGVLPGVAILLALQPFDAEVPTASLPWWLRDAMLSTLVAAGAAWLFGYSRHRHIALLHAGNAPLGLAALRLVDALTAEDPTSAVAAIASNDLWTVVLYATAGYLGLVAFLRRSRIEAWAALTVHLVAVVLLVWEKTPADNLIICLVAGWSVLIGLHLACPRPRLLVRLVPLAFLAIAPWTCDAAPSFRWPVCTHAAVMIFTLLVVGHLWRWTQYRLTAGLLVVAHLAVLAERLTFHGAYLLAEVLVGAGFALLVGGTLISWHKRRLLDSIRARDLDGLPG